VIGYGREERPRIVPALEERKEGRKMRMMCELQIALTLKLVGAQRDTYPVAAWAGRTEYLL
jgi:hypothetical protein